MNSEPTSTISLDYLVELSDDGEPTDPPRPEILLIPPTPGDTASSPAPADAQEQGPQR